MCYPWWRKLKENPQRVAKNDTGYIERTVMARYKKMKEEEEPKKKKTKKSTVKN